MPGLEGFYWGLGSGSSSEMHHTILRVRASPQGTPCQDLGFFFWGLGGIGELGTCGSLATFSFRVSLEFPMLPLLVSDSVQGFPIRHLLVSDSVLLWFPNRFPSVSDSRLGFRFVFCWFPIRLSLGFRFVFLRFPIRFLGFRLGFAGFRFGVSDSPRYGDPPSREKGVLWTNRGFGGRPGGSVDQPLRSSGSGRVSSDGPFSL